MKADDLANRQSLPLEQKIVLSQRRIKEWYDAFSGDVYVSFSGGKDSTVLLDIVRNTPGVYDVPAVFCDTGLEYPEVREFAISVADVVIRPKMTFKKVIERYGYPVVSKEQARYIYDIRTTNSDKLRNLRLHGGAKGRFKVSEKWRYLIDAPFLISDRCCDVMKKRPFHAYEQASGRRPYIGTMACESVMRKQGYLQHGCNSFYSSNPKSSPLGFWLENDVLRYIKESGIAYASVYGEIVSADLFGDVLTLTGCSRTGCMFCCFGVDQEPRPNRFEMMRSTHPKHYAYCMSQLGLAEVLDYMHIPR